MRALVAALLLATACSHHQPSAQPTASKPAAPPHDDSVPPDHPSVDHPSTEPTDMSPHATPHGPTVVATTPHTLDKLADGRYALGPFSVAPPAGWTQIPVTSAMRVAQFVLGDAEIVVTYFGEGGAGDLAANVERWESQVTRGDGAPNKAKIETRKVGGQDATFATLAGHYVGSDMASGKTIDIPDATFIGAILGSPNGPYYVRIYGPKKTLDARARELDAFFASFKLK